MDEKTVYTCHMCGKTSPEVTTGYTLCSIKHGWRLTIEMVDNKRTPVWRCPVCWAKYKLLKDPSQRDSCY